MTTSETAFGTTWPTAEQAPFPRVVADLDGNSWPWWAFRTPLGDVLWTPVPTLPYEGAVWADETDTIIWDHIVLTEDVLAELLYSSALAPGTHSRTELAQTVEARLYAFRCCVESHPEHNEPHRLADCHAWARELIGETR